MTHLTQLPIIDLSPYLTQKSTTQLAHQIRDVSKNIGFFYIKNHGVSQDLQKSILKHTRQFFGLPRDIKQQVHMSKGGKAWRGYFQLGEQYTSGKIDLKEGLYLGQQLDQTHPKVQAQTPLHGANLFPIQCPELKEDILIWLREMAKLGQVLMQAIAESLGLEREYFKKGVCKEHTGLLRLFHYPIDDNPNKSLWAVGEHTDYGLLTILLISDKGLQVQNREGQWIQVPPIEDTFVINIGDILQKMTGGLYKSTPHRAKNTEGRSRYAIPYFYDPGWDSEIKQIEIKTSEEQKHLQRAARKFKRWDEVDIMTVQGTYGKYLMSKVSKVFPDLANQNLSP